MSTLRVLSGFLSSLKSDDSQPIVLIGRKEGIKFFCTVDITGGHEEDIMGQSLLVEARDL